MKQEWKKHEKDLYGATRVPRLITVPAQNYIMITGKGNPNHLDFSERVSVLYSLAYCVKMNYMAWAKKEECTAGVDDYTVYPLEGVWQQKKGADLIKEDLEYTIMIRQPDFITGEMVLSALEKTKIKKPSTHLDEIVFDTSQDGPCVEILHIGSFDEEPVSFKKMDEFTEQNGLKRVMNCHRELYLNNANRVPQSKLQTILRYQVES